MTQNDAISKKLRLSGMVIMVGLVVEALSLTWNHPLSFVAFLGIGGLALFLGVLIYLLALVGGGNAPE
jgi:Flp pilus assembly protein protease CpaA